MPLDRARADEHLAGDLRVGGAVSGKSGDLTLLRGQVVTRLDGTAAYRLPGREELPARTLGEARHPDLGEHLVRGAQLFAGVDPAALAAQPFAVQQVHARQTHPDPRTAQEIDRLPIQPVGDLTLAHQRPATGLGAQRPVRSAGLRPFLEQELEFDPQGDGWEARLTQLEDYKIVSLSSGQVRLLVTGDADEVRGMLSRLAPRLFRGGG